MFIARSLCVRRALNYVNAESAEEEQKSTERVQQQDHRERAHFKYSYHHTHETDLRNLTSKHVINLVAAAIKKRRPRRR